MIFAEDISGYTYQEKREIQNFKDCIFITIFLGFHSMLSERTPKEQIMNMVDTLEKLLQGFVKSIDF